MAPLRWGAAMCGCVVPLDRPGGHGDRRDARPQDVNSDVVMLETRTKMDTRVCLCLDIASGEEINGVRYVFRVKVVFPYGKVGMAGEAGLFSEVFVDEGLWSDHLDAGAAGSGQEMLVSAYDDSGSDDQSNRVRRLHSRHVPDGRLCDCQRRLCLRRVPVEAARGIGPADPVKPTPAHLRIAEQGETARTAVAIQHQG